MKRFGKRIVFGLVMVVAGFLVLRMVSPGTVNSVISRSLFQSNQDYESQIQESRANNFVKGRHVFRFDTFGDEKWWGQTLRLHEAIKGEKLGGVGPGLSPKAALGLGLKVDVEALPKDMIKDIEEGRVNLDDPAVTVALLKANAVVGVTGFFDQKGNLVSMGIQCALCHSIVDDSLAPGIGKRLDGWANRDLNVGKIISLAPNLKAYADVLGVRVTTARKILESWGPGKFDAILILDGKAFRPDGKSGAVLIPAAFGLQGFNLITWTGWGSIPYWNALVANIEMQGQGRFWDPRLKNAGQFPIAARNGFYDIRKKPDLISSKLPSLHYYQMSLPAPKAPEGSYNKVAAERGRLLFNTKARCARCHTPGLFTDPGWNLHTPQSIGIDSFQANRSPDRRYRTSNLKGLWTHQKGGFYHDGRFKTLLDVVEHYNIVLKLGLTEGEKKDLVQYLKSL